MSNKVQSIEIIEIYNIKGNPILDKCYPQVLIIPDPSIKFGFTQKIANKIFVNPRNYKDLRELSSGPIMSLINDLEEQISG